MTYYPTIQKQHGLTNAQLAEVCPSAAATEPAGKCSANYLYIPTMDIVNGMRDRGFVPTWATESKTRMEGAAGHTKHIVRFAQVKDLERRADERPEVVLVGSHDWTSAFRAISGVFRMVCSNGMISGDKGAELRVMHRGDFLQDILAATYKIAEQAEATMAFIEEAKQIMLDERERLAFAKYATAARFDLDANAVEGSLVSQDPNADRYNPRALLQVWRAEDRGHDLYTTLNVIQENALGNSRFGVRAKNGNRMRQVKEIGKTVEVNQLLWQFARELRDFKVNG